MAVSTRLVAYQIEDHQFEGLLAWDDSVSAVRPGVLVSHTIRGRTAFEEEKARLLAQQGYCAMALDVYGRDQIGNLEHSRNNMEALKSNRPELQRRLIGALGALTAQPEVDAAEVAAIGYCFGGLCVLDLARMNAALRGVASFHGIFAPPENLTVRRSNVRVLAMHGWDDPLATPDEVVAFGEEMTAREIEWQLHAYGHTMHAFTNPEAADEERGTVYAPLADRRSWRTMTDFLQEVFD